MRFCLGISEFILYVIDFRIVMLSSVIDLGGNRVPVSASAI
jgi:hypothetical protein